MLEIYRAPETLPECTTLPVRLVVLRSLLPPPAALLG